VGQSYSATPLQATDYNYTYTWSIESSELPPGLQFVSSSSLLVYITGTPTTVGTYTFTLKIENAGGSDTKEFTIKIELPPPPVITTTSLPDCEIGQSYFVILSATESATWSIASGNLPPGLQLPYVQIYGTPTTVGTYTFTLKAENASGSDTKEFSIRVRSAAEASCIAEGKVWENDDCRAKTPAEVCTEAGKLWENNSCWTAAELAEANCLAEDKVWESNVCRAKTPAEVCTESGKLWENNQCTTPIRLPQIASSNILAYAMGNSIVLQNLPSGAKVDVFGLSGKLVYSNRVNPLIGGIGVQTIEVHTKGVYIVKVSSGSEKKALRVAVR
jgi:PKD repeat protein